MDSSSASDAFSSPGRAPADSPDELFRKSDFFDPHDLLQVKCEMLWRIRVDDKPIRRVAQDFSFFAH